MLSGQDVLMDLDKPVPEADALEQQQPVVPERTVQATHHQRRRARGRLARAVGGGALRRRRPLSIAEAR